MRGIMETFMYCGGTRNGGCPLIVQLANTHQHFEHAHPFATMILLLLFFPQMFLHM